MKSVLIQNYIKSILLMNAFFNTLHINTLTKAIESLVSLESSRIPKVFEQYILYLGNFLIKNYVIFEVISTIKYKITHRKRFGLKILTARNRPK